MNIRRNREHKISSGLDIPKKCRRCPVLIHLVQRMEYEEQSGLSDYLASVSFDMLDEGVTDETQKSLAQTSMKRLENFYSDQEVANALVEDRGLCPGTYKANIGLLVRVKACGHPDLPNFIDNTIVSAQLNTPAQQQAIKEQ